MTVADLIEGLQELDQFAQVCIGMRQHYGTDFEYSIQDIETMKEKTYIIMGEQLGPLPDSDEDDDDEEDWDCDGEDEG
jgi:hypothetical protein